jgi:hypothetical protein
MNAARAGNLELLQWARANGCPWNTSALLHACSKGHLEVVKWLIDNNCDWVEYALPVLGEAGHYDVLDFLRERKFWVRDMESIFLAGAMGNKPKMFEYLNTVGNELPDYRPSSFLSLLYEPLSVFLEAPRQNLPDQFYTAAAFLGRLDILSAAEEAGHRLPKEEIIVAAIFGVHADILKWIAENGFREQICRNAGEFTATVGKLKALQFLIDELGAPWAKKIAVAAAKTGKIEILKWAFSRGFPMSRKKIMLSAAANCDGPFSLDSRSKLEILRWGRREGFPFLVKELLDQAARNKDLKIFRWLLKQGGEEIPVCFLLSCFLFPAFLLPASCFLIPAYSICCFPLLTSLLSLLFPYILLLPPTTHLTIYSSSQPSPSIPPMKNLNTSSPFPRPKPPSPWPASSPIY